MPTSAHWEEMNSPQISIKPAYSAGGQDRPPLQGRARVVAGADDSVGLMRSYEFAEDFSKTGASCRVDVYRQAADPHP